MAKDSIRLSPKHGVNPMILQCPLCAQEKNEIALLGQLKNDAEAPRVGVLPGSGPCDECEENMRAGFLLIEVQEWGEKENPVRTGKRTVIRREAAERLFRKEFMSRGAAFVSEAALKHLMGEDEYCRAFDLAKGEKK